ncbi:MAG: hypothetical protein CM1200mP1_05930 [Candidatus Neomarinimicrobiota bacterium]|nr:MAG: hypothetical protein CM1200mP1_05930 [Candidatus Neomarinimicrobiota bacterium]
MDSTFSLFINKTSVGLKPNDIKIFFLISTSTFFSYFSFKDESARKEKMLAQLLLPSQKLMYNDYCAYRACLRLIFA